MKGIGITTVILLTCSLCFASQRSEVASYGEVGEREFHGYEARQPVWPNERELPDRAVDCHELYPWQEVPAIELDGEREARCLPPRESDHHDVFGPAMPDIEFDGRYGTGSIRELSMPELEEVAGPLRTNEVVQARRPAQARRPVQARRPAQARQVVPARGPGHARPPVRLDGGDNARSLPPIEFDHHTVFGPAMPNIEFDGWYETRCQKPRRHDGNQAARLLPPALAW